MVDQRRNNNRPDKISTHTTAALWSSGVVHSAAKASFLLLLLLQFLLVGSFRRNGEKTVASAFRAARPIPRRHLFAKTLDTEFFFGNRGSPDLLLRKMTTDTTTTADAEATKPARAFSNRLFLSHIDYKNHDAGDTASDNDSDNDNDNDNDLSPEVVRNRLEEIFSRFGSVQEIYLSNKEDPNRIKDGEQARPPFGFIAMETTREAQAALDELGSEDGKAKRLFRAVAPAHVHKSKNNKQNKNERLRSERLSEFRLRSSFIVSSSSSSSNNNNTVDPVIGRHEEIRRCLQILARRTKCNPVLIGQAGVGKTAVVEGLPQRIVSGQVPESIKHKRVLSLDVAGLMSGAYMRGQFEERLKGVVKEVTESNGSVILFIDEIHLIATAGKGEGSMDMGNMLKPALARGDLQLIGATTLDEYRILEKDPALARRFQGDYVEEPTVEDTLSILRGLKPHYELHHAGIRIKDEALVAAAEMSDRYINDRFQPDKSIDLVDEACSKLRLEQESKPEVLWKVERDLMTKRIEASALRGEDDKDSIKRRESVESEVRELEERVQKLTTVWQEERNSLNRVKQLKEKLAKLQREMELARSRGDFKKAGELLHSTIPDLQHELDEREREEDRERDKAPNIKNSRLPADAVDANAIATIVALATGIPVSKITGKEFRKLLDIEDELRNRVVGQDHALTAVLNCVRLSRTGLQARDRTRGNFRCAGPSGVGKTELCKALAEFLFDDQNAMTRIDMSEFGGKHTVSRLIRSPPGYVGHENGGVLTEAIRRRPFQVILLDEFEKADPEVWNLLLQLFDDGRLTDSHGRQVDFSNVIVVMTSNMGTQIRSELPSHLKGNESSVKESIMDVVRKNLSPELMNRIDETVVFNRLQREHMDQIADIQIEQIVMRLDKHQDMALEVSPGAKTCIAEHGFDVRYGARPLKRALAIEILVPLSKAILEGEVREADLVPVANRGEAWKLQSKGKARFGWVTGADHRSRDRNDVVILKNHEAYSHHDVVGETSGEEDNHGHEEWGGGLKRMVEQA